IELLFQCLKNNPLERPRTLSDVAEILLKGYFETTSKAYHREQPAPADLMADALNNRAMSLLDIGRVPETLEILESVLKTDPYHPEGTFNHSMLAWHQGKITDLDVLSRLQSLQPGTVKKERLSALLKKGDQERYVFEERDFGFHSVMALHLRKKLVALRTDYQQFRILSLVPGEKDLLFADEPESPLRVNDDGAFDATSQYFLTSDFEGFSIWDLPSQRKRRCEALPKKLRISMLLPPVLLNDQRVLYASSDKAFVWPPQKSEPVPLCVGHSDNIRSISLDENEKRILTASLDGTARLWNSDSGWCEHVYNISSSGALFACFSPDGQTLVACGRDGGISLWQTSGSRRKIKEFEIHPGFATNAALHKSGKLLAIWEESWSQETHSIRSGIIRIYDLDTLRCLRSFPGLDRKHKGQLVYSDDGETLFAHSRVIGLKSFRLLEAGKPAGWEICRPKSPVTLIAIQKEFKQLVQHARKLLLDANFNGAHELLRNAVASYPEYRFDEEITDLFRALHSYGAPVSLAGYWCSRIFQSKDLLPVTAVRFLPGLSWITGTSQGALQLWDVDRGKDSVTLKGHHSAIRKILKASRSSRALTVDAQNHLRAWDLLEQKCLAYFDCSRRENVFDVLCLSSDGTKAFSSDKEEMIYIWDLEMEELDQTIALPKQRGILNQIHYSDDQVLLEFESGWIDLNSGKEISAPPSEKRVRFYLENGKIIADSSIIGDDLSHALSFDLTEEGRYLVCGTEAGQIQLWELDWNLSFKGAE
ncbi:hypothetical protein L0156_12460, partial [bacterium]|nr:hypothetical protein [bacterium]